MKNSLRIFLAMILLAFWVSGAYAQTVYLEDYTCSSSVETYTPLGSTATVATPTSDDDGYATLTLPFAFTFGSTTMTAGSNIYMSVNGFITLNTSYSSTAPSYSGNYDVISPLGQDLHLRTSGQLKYEVSGTSPNREFTMEWSNVESYSSGNLYNFQVKLYEGSSDIKFCYGNSTVTGSRSVYCFLREYTQNDYVIAMNNWNSPVFVTTGSTFTMNLDASQYPSNGRTYTFARPTPTCNKPTMLTLGAVTANSATISWTAGGSETSWEVICAELTDNISTLIPTMVYTPSYTAQNLVNDHQYVLYVRALCPNGTETSPWRTMIFRTDCGNGIQSLPYTEDFSSYGGTGSYTYFPSCWNRFSTAGSYPYISATGGSSLYLYTSAGNYTFATSPALDPAIGMSNVAVRFKMYAGSQSYVLKVGVMSDSSDINTFVPVATFTPSAASTWEEKDVYFNTYSGTGRYIAFLSDSRQLTSTNTVYIDDVTITPMPTCARPASLTGINATDNSITLQWASAGTESQWNVKYYATGDTTTMITTIANSNPFMVSGLTANTSYTFFVQANCGSETSDWSAAYITPTLYVAPAVLPYICDFESSTEAANWGFENDTCANKWVVGDAVNNTTSGNSALYVSNDNGLSNNYTFTAPATIFAVRDIYMDNSYDYYTVSYDYKGMGQGTTDYLRLYLGMMGISMVQGNAMGSIPSIPGAAALSINESTYQSGQADWRHVYLYLDKETWGNRVLRLYYMWHNDASGGTNPAAAIDNLEVKGYNCERVTSIAVDANTLTQTSATITWTDTLNVGSYEVVIVPQGGNPDSQTPISVSTTSYTFTGLTHSTEYVAYVRVSCGSSVSAWQGVSFSTVCGPISTLPYTQNFDNMPTGSSADLPNCWTRVNNYSTYPYLSTSYHASGNASLYFYGTTSYYSYAVLPEIDTIAYPMNTLMMSLKSLKTSTTATYGRFDVGVMSDPSNVSTFTVVKSFYGTDMSSTATWFNQEVLFNNYAGHGSYMAIRIPNEGTSYVYIDDIEVTTIPTCLSPADIVLSGISSDAVTISWTPRNSEYNWNVIVVPHGTDPSTATPEMTSTYPYTVSNLTPNTQYDVYVQADCGNGDESPWSPATTFTTKCVPTSTIPYTESFEGIGTGTAAFPSCWTRVSTYNPQYPYISTSIHSDGAAALYFYQPSGYSTYALTQALDLSTYNPGELALSFFISAYSNVSYARMDVGIMTDPTDLNTLSILKSFYPNDFTATNTWNKIVIPLTQNFTTPVYFAFVVPTSSTTIYMYLDQVKVDYAPSCYAPSNFHVASVGAASAHLTWNDAINGTDYVVEYAEHGQNNWQQVFVTGSNNTFIQGLTQGSSYDVMLYTDCGSDYSDTLTLSFTTPIMTDCVQPDPNDITITGTTASTTYYVPVNNFYNYTYSQQIYTANEVSPAGTPTIITGLAFNYGYTSSNNKKTDVKIYLAHRSTSTFSSSSNWTSISSATLVYEGPLVCTNGWNTFNFQNFFNYNGTDNLVVIVDDNSGGYNSSSYVFNGHTTTGNTVLYYYTDGTNPNPSSPPSGTLYSTRPDIKFFKCNQTAPMTCIAPNVAVTSVTPQDITVNWAPGGSETQWELSYKIGSGNWISLGTVTTPPYVMTNVQTDVDYTFRMRSDCGNNEYSNYATTTAHVPCAYVTTLPYTEGFEATTGSGSGHMASCWTRGTNYASTQYPYTSTSQHFSGSYSVYFYGTSSYYSYIASPRFDDSIAMDSLLISFQAYKTSANYFIEIGVMSNPYDITTFTPVGTFSPQAVNTFEFGDALTSNYAGNGHYIAFRCPQWVTNYMYLDNVTVDYIPSCRYVRNLHAVANTVTTNSAHIAWNPGGDETDWELVCTTSANVADPSTLTIETIQNTPYFDLTNLTPNTTYYVYVRANCGSDYSPWMKCNFHTDCAPIDALPYVMDFENVPSINSTSPSQSYIPYCWDYHNTSTSTSSAYRFYPIDYNSSSYAHSGTTSMRFYTYSTTSTYGDQYAILPEIDVTTLPINTLRLTFWQRSYTTGTSYSFPLIVGVMNGTSIGTFTPVDTFTMTTTTYTQRTVDFDNYTGTGNRIAFKVARPTTAVYNSGYVDDIVIENIPQCATPTNLNVSSVSGTEATISWTPGGQEYEWNLSVYPDGQTPSAGVTVTVNSTTTYTVTNLTPGTHYQVALSAVCPNGNGNSASATQAFVTTCELLTTLPYTQNFDGVAGATTTSVSTNNLPDCWMYHNEGTSTSYSGYPIVYSSSSSASSGTNSVRFYVLSTTGTYAPQWAILPGIDATLNPMNTLKLDFDARAMNTSYNFVLEVGVMSNPMNPSTFTLVNTVTVSSTTYEHYEVYFANYTGTGNYIAIRAPQSSSSNYGYLDNVVVDLAPTCSPVNNLAVSQVTATSALVTWDQGVTGVPFGFELEYSEHNQNNWTTFVTQDNFYFLSGLNMNTTYDVRVRTDCGSETSTWETDQFTTSNCLSTSEIAIGTGTDRTFELPLNNFWEYSYTQQIFLASEMGGAATITNVSFEYAYSSSSSVKNSVIVYLGHTTKSTFTSDTDYVPISGLTQVYSGNMNCHQGWNTFTFNTPFQYNGADNLVLVIDDNSGDYDGSEYEFYCHSTGSNYRSIHYYMDGTDILPSNPMASHPSVDYTRGYRNNVKFGLPCDNSVTCVAPNVYVTNITPNTAEVYWAPGYVETAWNFEYKAQNATTWTAVTGAVSPVQLTGLLPNTHYQVRVQSDCSSETSGWTVKSFTTECSSVTVPYTHNFDNEGTGSNAHPSCWTVMDNHSTTVSYPYISTSYHYSGVAALYFYCSPSTYNVAVSPQIDLSNTQMNNLQVSFQMRSTSSTTTGMIIGVMTDPNDLTTFVPVDTVYNSVTATFEFFEVPLISYNGPGEYVALKILNTAGTYSAYIDNFMIDNIPSCVRPYNFTATATTTDITLGWDDGNTGYEWIIEYGPGNFTQGNGTTVVANSNPYTITGLTASTAYTFYVRGICSATDSSYWSLPFHTTTSCAAITQVPYMENFDSYAGSTTTSVSVNNLPVCWHNINNGTNSSYSGYPIIYASNAASSPNAMRFYTYITSGSYDDQIAVMPQIDVTVLQLNTLQVSFDARANTTSYPFKLVVGIMTNPTNKNTFVPIDTITTQVTTYLNYEVPFSHYTGTGSYIAFMVPRPTSGYNYGYVDNVTVELIPNCPKPTHVTASNPTTTSLTLSWTENGTASNWVVEYGPAGFAHGAGNTVQVQGTPSTTITGLSASTTYDFYVKADCGGGDESAWSAVSSGNTACGLITSMPYIESFDTYGTGTTVYPLCWSKINTYTSADRPYVNATHYDGVGSLYFFAGTSGTYNIAITPEFSSSIPVNGMTATFMYRCTYTSDRLIVGVMSSTTDASTFVPVDTIHVSSTSTWYPQTVSFANYTGNGHYVAFKNAYTTQSGYGYIDNLVITLDSSITPNTCLAPTGVTASNVTQTSATITWTAGGTETAWELQYKTAAASNWSNAINVTGTPSYNLTGLTAGTQYQVRVHAVCSATETSNWSGIATFTTSQASVTPPTVTTNDATVITQTTAVLNGTVAAGSEAITSQGFEWKATVGGSYAAVNATGTTMSYNLQGLTQNTGYTFRAFAITASGTTYGAEKTFTTTNEQPTCPAPINVTASNITETTAVVSWTQPDNTANSWDVLYKESAASSWYTATTSNNPYTLAGLTANTSYDVQIIAHCTNGQTSDPSATITLMTVGIDNYTLDNTVTVYPNPTTGVVQIKNEELRMKSVEVYDVYGKLLHAMSVNDHTANLDLSGYAKGTYFVKVTTEKGVVTKRVVKN